MNEEGVPLQLILGTWALQYNHRTQNHTANFATNLPSVVDTGVKFATSVNDTDSKFAAGVNDK